MTVNQLSFAHKIIFYEISEYFLLVDISCREPVRHWFWYKLTLIYIYYYVFKSMLTSLLLNP